MIGHNWGSEHAERWVWLEGTGFGDGDGTYFDAGAARVKVGPMKTPWIGAGMLMLDGGDAPARRLRPHPLIEDLRDLDHCEFVLPGEDLEVRGWIAAPAKDFVAGSTPTRRAPSTTSSTARSPTSS